MKGREAKASSSSTDLLVCFPPRVHLTLMPKPICSPARPQAHNKRHRLKKSNTTRNVGHASPLLWNNNAKSMGSEIAEPTSPKVTCAGQIKVRPKTVACKSWQTVMEEIEKIHNSNKQKKRLSWVHSLSFKKEVVQLLTCLRGMRLLDMQCFGTFPEGDEDEDEGYGETHVVVEESYSVFSKWLMVLQENQSNGLHKEDTDDKVIKDEASSGEAEEATVPPPNALLLMRCRSAPVKSWLKENEEEDNEEREKEEQNEHVEVQGEVKEKAGVKKGKSLKSLMEENRKKENLVVMRYDSDCYKISSSDIAKDTWIVG